MVEAIKNVIHKYYILLYRIVWEIENSYFIAFETSWSIAFSLISECKPNKKKNQLFLSSYYP